MIQGEWNIMIGYEMDSLSIGVYNTTKISPLKNFEDRWKNDMDIALPTHLL